MSNDKNEFNLGAELEDLAKRVKDDDPVRQSSGGESREPNGRFYNNGNDSDGENQDYTIDTVPTVSLRDIYDNAIPEYPYPFEVFPKRFQELIQRESEALSVEPEILAHIKMTLASGAVGNSTRIAAKPSHVVPLFLWSVVIETTGYGKSHAISTSLKPIQDKQDRAYIRYTKELGEYNRQVKEHNKQSKRKESSL